MSPLAWVPGHLCGNWLFESLRGRWPGPETVADIASDDTLGAMAERLLEAAPGRFAVAGLSMGGMVAMEAAARAPGRVAGLLLMSTDPWPAREKEKAWRAGEMETVRREGTAGYAARFTAKFFAHDEGVAVRLGPRVLERAARVPAEVCLAQARALDARRDMTGVMQRYGGPVEILVGAQDRVCPPKLHRALAAACPDAALTEVPGCGHLSCVEAPEAAAAALDRLAARLRR